MAPLLAKNKNYNVHSISLIDESSEGVIHHKYSLEQTTSGTVHPLAQEFEAKIIRANSLSKLAYKMKSEGIMADLIIGHPGWGETLFIKNVWPDSKLLSYFNNFSKNSTSVHINIYFCSSFGFAIFTITKNLFWL